MTTISLKPSRELLKQTTSRCPVCHAAVPGEVWREGAHPGRVVLRRTCPEHGEHVATLASDARFYWKSMGRREEGGCCGGQCCSADGSATGTLGRNADGREGSPFEALSTCLALIEIVRSCNLSCPTCYADSPLGSGARVDAVPLDEIQARIAGVIARKGGIEILQLSGGEPTLHPRLFELLAWIQDHPKIDYALINTNGVRLAHDAAFAEQLAEAAKRRKLQLYLQFDGVQEAAQRTLRGADLRATREAAIARCAGMDLPVTLAMTVTPENLPHVWEAIAFGLSHPHVHGITFQPMFTSGRTSRGAGLQQIKPSLSREPLTPALSPSDGERVAEGRVRGRLNAADVILAAIAQSDGKLTFKDFTPLPCGDPNCAIIGYLLRIDGRVRSVGEFMDFAHLQGFLHDRVQYTLADLAQCGCEAEPLGAVLKQLELRSSVAFRIMIKPFMDAWTWDQDRIDRCCTHVIRPDGQLDSFCRYYSGFPDTQEAP